MFRSHDALKKFIEIVPSDYNVGFDGPMIDDHVPQMVGDSDRQHRSRAYAIGYMKALMEVVTAENGGNST